jgi:hypothetical protein
VSPESGPPRRPPSEYRPDLRPLALLAALLVAVILGWVLLGPMILPPTTHPGPGALDGRWTISPEAPLATTLEIRDGTFQLAGDLLLTGAGSASVAGSTLMLDGPQPCAARGSYRFTLADVDRPGLLPQFRSQTVSLQALDDGCTVRRDVLTSQRWVLRASLRAGVHGICDPPNEEAAITGHWPEPAGCSQ